MLGLEALTEHRAGFVDLLNGIERLMLSLACISFPLVTVFTSYESFLPYLQSVVFNTCRSLNCTLIYVTIITIIKGLIHDDLLYLLIDFFLRILRLNRHL